MKDILLLAGLIGAWYVFNRWVLPKLGVQT